MERKGVERKGRETLGVPLAGCRLVFHFLGTVGGCRYEATSLRLFLSVSPRDMRR